MKSKSIFDERHMMIIDEYGRLKNWFERNSEMLHKNFTDYDSLNCDPSVVGNDIYVLGKMVSASLQWMDMTNAMLSSHAKAFNATSSMTRVYEMEKEKLSDEAKESFKIENEKIMRRIYERKN